MRNFKDLSRALESIAGGLKSIKDIIDTIEPGGGGAGGVDYSTTETDTGLKWIDGEAVYQIVLTSGTTSGTGFVEFDVTDLTIDTLIDAHAVYYQTNTGYEGAAAAYGVNARVVGDTTLKLDRAGSSSASEFDAVIRYTKKSA